MRSIIKRYKINDEGIDSISRELEAYLERIGIALRNRLRIRLSYEESLLRMRDRFGEETEVILTLGKWGRRPFIELSHYGEQFNPLSKREVSMEDWSGSLLTSVGLYPQYGFSKGRNSLRLNLPGRVLNPALKVLIGVAIGTVFGLLLINILSPAGQEKLINVALEPLYHLWVRILSVLSGPVIFLMVMTTVLNTGNIEEEGGSSRKVVARYFMFSILMAMITIVLCLVLSPDVRITLDKLGINMGKALDYIFHIVPKDAFTPLIEANTPQILLMAFVLGNGMVIIGSRAEGLVSLVRQINEVGLLMIRWIGECVPYITAGLVCYEIIIKETGLLMDLWRVIAMAFLLSTAVLLVILAYVSRKKGTGMGVLLSKLWPHFAKAVKTGGLDKGYGEMEESTSRLLGIEKHFAETSLLQGIILFMPVNVLGTMLLTIFGAVQFGISLSVGWLLTAGLLSVVMFVATPPVLGANLLAYIMIFSFLDVPEEMLISAMIFEVLFGIFASAGNQAMLQMDLIVQADKIGLLDKEQLRKPIRKPLID